jgi:hypothetical protein
MADVWDFGPDDPIDNSVLLRLANHCNDQGRQCFPSIEDVAKKVRRSESTVKRSIVQLETDGWITVERGVGKGNFSHYVINVARLKERQDDDFAEPKRCQPATFSDPKRCQPQQQKVSATTAKGVSHENPPHPLYGRNIKEPSGEPSGAEAQAPPAPENLRPVNPDAGQELQAAVWFFEELAVPSDFGMRNLATQAIRMQAKEWGGVEEAARRILAAAKDAKAGGETRWRFWLQDSGYLKQQGKGGNTHGTTKPSVTHERVNGNLKAIAKMLERRGVAGVGSADCADGAEIPEPGFERFDGGLHDGLRATGVEVLPPEAPRSAGGAPDRSQSELFSKTG